MRLSTLRVATLMAKSVDGDAGDAVDEDAGED
jgi:hypothetical protein